MAGAEWGKSSPDRLAQRNVYRHRGVDTRVGTIDAAIAKLRSGTDFPDWLLERRERAKSALITVAIDRYLARTFPDSPNDPGNGFGRTTLTSDSIVKSVAAPTASGLSQPGYDHPPRRRRVGRSDR